MVKRTAIVPFLLVLLANGFQCGDKIELKATPVELMALVDSFASECLRRGIGVDISPASLQVGFGRIADQSGKCKPYSHPKVITIDSMTWKALSQPVREMLVYHELAHCLLQRKHTNDVLPSGECKSWMREDDTRCKINSLNTKWRQYYIEELFSAEKLAEPVWYAFGQHPDPNQEDVTPGKIITTKSNTLIFDTSFFRAENDWKIIVHFSEPKNFPGSLGIKINEYTMEFISISELTGAPKSTFIKSMMLDQFKIRTDQNVLFWDSLSSAHDEFELSIKKIKTTVYVFFENDLRACIPIVNSLKLTGYSAFKRKGPYMIRVYASEQTKI